ncbi:MAG: response regulator receiver protein [Pedosphaera sp.]|nr:response regulator receiver protein [Pedosphaera sp.]
MLEQRRGILLVEDDDNDVFLMKRAMSKARLDPPMHIAVNGQEALDYLQGKGRYADRDVHPIPQCIFLGLKLPFVDGFEVPEWMRKQPSLSEISVFILTSSPEDRDRQRANQLGAKAYLVKPPTPEALIQVLKASPECGVFIAEGNSALLA